MRAILIDTETGSRGRVAGTLRSVILGAVLLAVALSASPVEAAEHTEVGEGGTPGGSGAAGNPGADGEDAGPGSAAVAEAISSDLANTATATGGIGGTGGTGGAGNPGTADGGNGGRGGDAGIALATADNTPPVSSFLSLRICTALATGGSGGIGGAGGATVTGLAGTGEDGGRGGAATASAIAGPIAPPGPPCPLCPTGGATVSATAIGGRGGDGGTEGFVSGAGISGSAGAGGDGGAASLGQLIAGSTQSGASVVGTAVGGSGGDATGDGRGGDGASVMLSDAVDGAAHGSAELRLEQHAAGGSSGAVAEGVNGRPGEARSELAKSHRDSSSLSVIASASGGGGGSRSSESGTAAPGGAATAISTATNGAVRIGIRAGVLAEATATGGAGGSVSGGADGGAGGRATATAMADLPNEPAPRGRATAEATATGGAGGTTGGGGRGGDGGDAVATALGSGVGRTGVIATASGGAGSDGGSHGSALARSTASGGSALGLGSNVTARAGSGGSGFIVWSEAAAQGGSQPFSAESRSTTGRPAPDRSEAAGFHAVAYATGLPTAGDVADALAGNPNVTAALQDRSGEAVLLGLLSGAFADGGEPGITQFQSACIELAVERSRQDHLDNLIVGWLDPEFTGKGFDELRVRLIRGIEVLVDESFFDLPTALDFFDDNPMNLEACSDGLEGELALRFVIDIATSNSGDGFSLTLLVAGLPSTHIFQVCRIIHDVDSNTVMLSWRSQEGCIYRVDRSGDLQSWVAIATVTAAGGGSTTYTDGEATGASGYYRVAIVAPEVPP